MEIQPAQQILIQSSQTVSIVCSVYHRMSLPVVQALNRVKQIVPETNYQQTRHNDSTRVWKMGIARAGCDGKLPSLSTIEMLLWSHKWL